MRFTENAFSTKSIFLLIGYSFQNNGSKDLKFLHIDINFYFLEKVLKMYYELITENIIHTENMLCRSCLSF